jgi:molybdopterin synthase catalytic subunit
MVKLTREPIDTASLVDAAQSPEAGAVVLFLGVARSLTNGRETTELTYEAFEAMAVKELQSLEVQARNRWSLVECAIVHRLGVVPLGEASVAVAVACPHRREAFEAGQWLIDTLKERVPIWKQEHGADGRTEWVHPGRTNVE